MKLAKTHRKTTTIQQMTQGHSLQLDANMLKAIEQLVLNIRDGFSTIQHVADLIRPTIVGSTSTTEVEKD